MSERHGMEGGVCVGEGGGREGEGRERRGGGGMEVEERKKNGAGGVEGMLRW